jgi:outer membrane autotransporter protein
MRSTLLATAATITLLGSGHAAENLVLDPGFESGAFGTWVSGGGGFTSISGASPNTGSFSFHGGCVGAACVVVGPTGVTGGGTATQAIDLQPGIYQASFYYRASGGTPNHLAVSLGNHTPIDLLNTAAAGYTQYSFISAVPTAGLTNLVFGIQNDPNFDDIDDVSLILVDDGAGNNIGAAAQTVAVQASRDLLDRLHDRFNHAGSPIQSASVRETVVAAAGSGTYVNAGGKYRAFMNVFGSHGEWGSNATEADRRGVSLGAEMAATQGLDVGAAFAFSRTDFDTKTGVTINIGDTYEYLGALYAHWTPSSMPLYVNVLGGYGSSSNDLSRANTLGSAAASDVSADQWFGSAEIGWDWQRSGVMLTPFVRFDIARVEQDGYTESASGLFVPAVVAGRDFDAMRSILGLRAEWDISSIGRYGAKVGAKAGWAHEFEQDRLVTFTQTVAPTVVLAGTATGAQPEEDTAVVGANFEVAIGGDTSIYAGYNGNFGGNQAINAGEAGVRVTW